MLVKKTDGEINAAAIVLTLVKIQEAVIRMVLVIYAKLVTGGLSVKKLVLKDAKVNVSRKLGTVSNA